MDLLDRMGTDGHHPEEDHLERYVMKACSEQETEEIEVHLFGCEQCRVRLYNAEEWVALMKAAVPLGPSPRKVPPWRLTLGQLFARPMLAAGCAAMAIALCVGTISLRDSFSPEERVELHATRGGTSQANPQANARSRLILKVDTQGLTLPLDMQVVNSEGAQVWSHAVAAADPEVKLDRKLDAGLYWVRLNSTEGDRRTVREFALNVH